jgi:hypothetical protein
MGEVVQYDAAKELERDRDAFRKMIEGVPAREIADELKCSIADVYAAQHRMCTGVTPEYRQRVLELEIARMETLHKVYFKKAEEGDIEAANWCSRRADQMSKWLGLNVLPRGEAVADESREPSSFEKVHEMIMQVARKGKVIDGELAEEQPKDG